MTNMLIISEFIKLQLKFRTNVELNRSYDIRYVLHYLSAAGSLVFCVFFFFFFYKLFSFCFFLLAIVLSVLFLFTASLCHFGISKHFYRHILAENNFMTKATLLISHFLQK